MVMGKILDFRLVEYGFSEILLFARQIYSFTLNVMTPFYIITQDNSRIIQCNVYNFMFYLTFISLSYLKVCVECCAFAPLEALLARLHPPQCPGN